MIGYEDYKKKVYDIFNSKCLKDVTPKEKQEYLKSQEELIRTSYNDDVYSYEKLRMTNVFNDSCIRSRICSNLEDLY